MSRRSTSRALTLTVCILAVTALAGAGRIAGSRPGAAPPASADAEFHGVGAEGRHMVWKGTTSGEAAGELTLRLTLRLAHAAPPQDAARPAPWPLEGVLFVAGAPHQSFAANVHGTVDWKAGRLELTGEIIEGGHRGSGLRYTARVDAGYGLRGAIQFVPLVAAAR